MRTIWKYSFEIADTFELHLPFGAKPIHVGIDPLGSPCMWFEVETNNVKSSLMFRVFGTGHRVPEAAWNHIGSFVHGEFVWHIYG